MEQILEREPKTKLDWRDIEMYYDDGRRITNPRTLHAMAETMELVSEWEKRIERYHYEDIFKKYEDEDGEDFDTEENEN